MLTFFGLFLFSFHASCAYFYFLQNKIFHFSSSLTIFTHDITRNPWLELYFYIVTIAQTLPTLFTTFSKFLTIFLSSFPHHATHLFYFYSVLYQVSSTCSWEVTQSQCVFVIASGIYCLQHFCTFFSTPTMLNWALHKELVSWFHYSFFCIGTCFYFYTAIFFFCLFYPSFFPTSYLWYFSSRVLWESTAYCTGLFMTVIHAW